MINLLSKSFRAFAVYAAIMLVAAIPVYFIVIDQIWVEEIDEHHAHIREKIEHQLNENSIDQAQFIQSLKTLNELQTGIKLTPTEAEAGMAIFYETNLKPEQSSIHEEERIRGYKAVITSPSGNFLIEIETSFEEANETFFAISMVTIFFLVFFILGLLLLQNRLNKKTWQPFYETLQKLHSFDLSKRKPLEFAKQNITEFEDLNQSIQALTHQNIKVYNQQKSFVENASHELQTPIALLKSKFDVLQQNEHLSEDLIEAIQRIDPILSRISRINKNLLLLAKVDNAQFNETQAISLNENIEETLQLFEDYIGTKGLIISMKMEDTTLSANPFLVETMLHNLIANAIKYSLASTTISIESNAQKLFIRNSGNAALNADEIFERFKRANASESGSGLGLSIVKEICHRYDWQIQYEFEHGEHIFLVSF